MAEALAVVGIVSSVVQLVDFSVKVVNRLNHFLKSVDAAPESFRDITLQLPLLVETLRRTQFHVNHGHYKPETEAVLQAVIRECHAQIVLLEDLLVEATPKNQDSKMIRSRKAICSLSNDKKLAKINSRLSGYIEKLIMFQSTIAPDYIINTIRQMLSLTPQHPQPCHATLEATTADASRDGSDVLDNRIETYTKRARRYRLDHYSHRQRRLSAFISFARLKILWAFQASLDLSWGSGGFSIAPALRLHRIVKYTSPGFEILWKCDRGHMDLQAAQRELEQLFRTGKASPLDVDPGGNTWIDKLLTSQLNAGHEMVLAFLKMLVECGAQLNINKSPLSLCACWNGWGPHIMLLEVLLALGYDASEDYYYDPKKWPLTVPVPFRHLRKEAVNMPDPFLVRFFQVCSKNTYGFWGQTLLMDAILCGSTDDIASRLQHSQSLDEKNVLGQSAVHFAVLRSTALSRLLEAGAKVDAQDNEGRSPLVYAAAYGCAKSVLLLLKARACPISDIDGGQHIAFLDYARVWHHWEVMTQAVSFFRASPCYPDDFINNELDHLMAMYANRRWEGKLGDLKCILKLGANPNLILKEGNTILHYITDRSEAELLFESGFKDIDRCNSKGTSPLMAALSTFDLYPYRIILERGANVNQKDQTGHSAMHKVCREMRHGETDYEISQASKRMSKTIAQAAALLHYGADPLMRDNCRCPCSKRGCSPSTLLLLPGYREHQGDLWATEWLLMIEEYDGTSATRQALLDLIRVKQFDKLGMTHLCCQRKRTPFKSSYPIEEEEIDEILDEERYLIQELEDFMSHFSELHDGPAQECWLNILSEYFVPEKERHVESWLWGIWQGSKVSKFGSQPTCQATFLESYGDLEVTAAGKPARCHYYAHELSDTFREDSGPRPLHLVSDSQLYACWVDHYNESNTMYRGPRTIDAEWYKTRKYWATRQAEVLEAVRTNIVEEGQRTT